MSDLERSPDGLPDMSLRAALPGLVRLAATSAVRTIEWSMRTSTAATNEVLRAVTSGESAAQVLAEAAVELRASARQLLGLDDDQDTSNELGRPHAPHLRTSRATQDELRRRGTELLYDSANVWLDEDTHPAYERILSELSPDEARILRLLAIEGPQPSIDVRTNRPLGVGSELVASGLSMIGLQAGVRHPERTNADLNNLYRLGLVWFSREQVADPTRYQVVEVQPDVLEAMKRAGRSPKTVHRSIHLTPFGEDFCALCFPLE